MSSDFLKRQPSRQELNSDEFLNMKSPAGLDVVAESTAGIAISAIISGGDPNIVTDIVANRASNSIFSPRKGSRVKKQFL